LDDLCLIIFFLCWRSAFRTEDRDDYSCHFIQQTRGYHHTKSHLVWYTFTFSAWLPGISPFRTPFCWTRVISNIFDSVNIRTRTDWKIECHFLTIQECLSIIMQKAKHVHKNWNTFSGIWIFHVSIGLLRNNSRSSSISLCHWEIYKNVWQYLIFHVDDEWNSMIYYVKQWSQNKFRKVPSTNSTVCCTAPTLDRSAMKMQYFEIKKCHYHRFFSK